jgi:3-isopropylmalate dehydrogenase
MAALLVRRPESFDVICATNFYADILSDLASELSGSLGLAGSINANETLCAAQAQHGSAPDIAGQNKANPISLIRGGPCVRPGKFGQQFLDNRCRIVVGLKL